MILDSIYQSLIVEEKNTKSFFIIINNKKIEVDIQVFMLFFGVHKSRIINNRRHYFISFKNTYEYEVSIEEYKSFSSHKSETVKECNIYSRYMEHSEQTESNLYHRAAYKIENINNILYKSILKERLYIAIDRLASIQKRRLIMYYFDNLTYDQIAKIEHCSKSAVKFSIDIAKEHLKKELNKFRFLD